MDQLNPTRTARSDIRPEISGTDNLNEFLDILSRTKYDAMRMVRIIKDLISSVRLALHQLPYAQNSYTRTILFRELTGFEVMVARWAKGAKTPIHGHPGFSLLFLIEGVLQEKSFFKKTKGVGEMGSQVLQAGDFSFEQGEEGRFDNAIHRITANEESLSLHIYSDDAIKGEIYSP